MKWAIFVVLATLLFPASAKDCKNMQGVITQLINSKNIDMYWHINTFPERVPIVVSLPSNLDVGKPKIHKFGQAVIFTNDPKDHKNVFSILSIDKNKTELSLGFTYPPEGIQGTAVYTKDRDDWKLMKVNVNEN